MNKWILATRPWSFPASAMPALVAIAFVFWADNTAEVSWINGVIALLGAILFQAAGNLISDYFDFKHGVDHGDSFGSSRLIVNGTFAPATILRFGLVVLGLGALVGLGLYFMSGAQVLWIGAVGVLGTFFYYRLKYVALGDLVIFLLYGQLIALGTAYVMTNELVWNILWVSAPVGFLVVNILHANNTRDILHDGQAHIKTVAMLLGIEGAKLQYTLLALGSYVTILGLVLARVLPLLSLITLITLPIALKCIGRIRQAQVMTPEVIKDLDGESAKLVMLFSLLLAISCFVAGVM